MNLLLLLILSSFTNASELNHERLQSIKELKRIAFGSCNNQNDEQPLWQDLIRQKPDLWIWGGDNVYADWKKANSVKRAYEKQNQNQDYKKFKQVTPIIGTWDDHDFGYDNANGNYPERDQSQKLALEFFEEDPNSPRWSQQGIYTSYRFGPREREVKIILLDNRYFKATDPAHPMLGKVQWEWLEQELASSEAKIHFIVTGLTVLSPIIPYSEEWGETAALSRMLEVLKKTKPKGLVFLTGDKHFSSIYQRYGHLEFLASGMTHVAPRKTWWYLRQKFPITYFGLNYGQIDLDWEGEIPLMTFSIRNPAGRGYFKRTYRWGESRWNRETKDLSSPTLSRR